MPTKFWYEASPTNKKDLDDLIHTIEHRLTTPGELEGDGEYSKQETRELEQALKKNLSRLKSMRTNMEAKANVENAKKMLQELQAHCGCEYPLELPENLTYDFNVPMELLFSTGSLDEADVMLLTKEAERVGAALVMEKKPSFIEGMNRYLSQLVARLQRGSAAAFKESVKESLRGI